MPLTGLTAKVGAMASRVKAAQAAAQPVPGSRSAVMQQAARTARLRGGQQHSGGGGQRAWQGTNREVFGGINVGHDWRTFQTRQVNPNNMVGQWIGQQIGETLKGGIAAKVDAPRPQIVPPNFAVAQERSDLYSTVSPQGATMPPAGSTVRGTQAARQSNFNAAVARRGGIGPLGMTAIHEPGYGIGPHPESTESTGGGEDQE